MYSPALSWFERYDGGCLALCARICVWYAGNLSNRRKLIDYCEQALLIRLKARLQVGIVGTDRILYEKKIERGAGPAYMDKGTAPSWRQATLAG